jgi:hypothetical protein
VEIDVIDNDFSLTDDQWRNFIFPLDYVRRFKSNLLQKVSGHEDKDFLQRNLTLIFIKNMNKKRSEEITSL